MKTTQYIFAALFLLVNYVSQAQGKENENTTKLFVSGGSHLGLWSLLGLEDIPYNVQIDYLISEKTALGIAYGYDNYKQQVFSCSIRENIRLRFYQYSDDPQKKFSTYAGASVGLSYWREDGLNLKNTVPTPTLQYLLGMKLRINETLFWVNEIGFGPPYAIQSSLGFNF